MNQPIWPIFNGGAEVSWTPHKDNPRFQIYHPGGTDNTGDLVWDRATGLVWARNTNLLGKQFAWLEANPEARIQTLGKLLGWRLPTVEELSSLIDTRNSNPALPTGHPFVGVQNDAYWTCTNDEQPAELNNPSDPGNAWFVNMGSGRTDSGSKKISSYVWLVRGGHGGVNWNR